MKICWEYTEDRKNFNSCDEVYIIFGGVCEIFIVIRRGLRLKMVMKHCLSFCSYSSFL